MKKLTPDERQALQQLFESHRTAIYRLARRIVCDPQLAEDVLQDSFLNVARRAKGKWLDRAWIHPWLLRVARNAAIDAVRKKRDAQQATGAVALTEQVDKQIRDALDELALAEFRADVEKALKTLHEGPRRALELAYFFGHTQREVANKLQIPVGTAKTWIRNGRAELVMLLSECLPHRARFNASDCYERSERLL